ncbi:hypothetical protein TCEA9_19490 [Thermobrachium celere]|nr:hypothetical protein TCEA9_19490 [Thermobrachium celere]
MQIVREKTIAGGNGAYSETERYAIAKHLEQLNEQIMQIGNTSYDGRYIFGGDKTTEPPFIKDNNKIKYNGSENGLIKEMSFGVTMDIGIKGKDFENIFSIIDNIVNRLNNNESSADELKNLDSAFDNLLRIRAEVGAKQKRLEDMLQKK